MFRSQFAQFLSAIIRPGYRWLFPLWAAIFLLLNIYINQLHVIGFAVFGYNPVIIVPYLIFTLLNTILTGISINLIIMRFRALGFRSTGGGGLSALGTMGALITGACPGCIAGFLPVFIGIFGINVPVTDLPLFGIGLQAVSFLLLLLGIYLLTRPIVCKVE